MLIVFCFLFLCLTAALPAWGKKEKVNTVQVTGIVRLVGSGTFPELVITGPDGEWHIEQNEEFMLKNLQHCEVTIEGDETVSEMRFASGRSAGERRSLKNIKIIAIKEPDYE